jgi:Thiol:disulfide interchange protein DsbD, N-terminal
LSKAKRLSNFKVAVILLILVTIVACSRSASGPVNQANASGASNQPVTSVGVVRAAGKAVEINPGGSVQGVVKVAVLPGYHVNANPASDTYLKATELEFPAAGGISVGFLSYPNPVVKKFAFSEKPLAVYEGETNVNVLLKADKSAKRGTQDFAGKLRVQACDEQVCYAPGTIDVAIPVTVK